MENNRDDLDFAFAPPAPRRESPRAVVKRDEEFAPEPVYAPRAYAAPLSGFAGRTLPHSLEAEENLLACCLLDGPDVMTRALDAGICAASYYDNRHGIIFETLTRLFIGGQSCDVSIVAEELKKAKQLEQVGNYAFLAQVSSRIPTTAQASYFISKVREQAILREIIRSATGVVEDCYGFSGGIEDFASEIHERISGVTRQASAESAIVARPITDFDYPLADDPNVLLGTDDYLGRGGGMLFVSHAGAGKSSFIMDGVMSWALGTPWMGIRCNGPLVTLIVQAEDSDRYIGKLRRSFAHVHNLTPEQDAQLGANCIIVRLKGKSGAAFFSALKKLVAKHKPDLVVINPIYLYAEGDISRSEFAQPFLVGLDDLNKDEKFGYILVHHTGKPQNKDAKGKRAELDDWETVYMGFGSSYLANWPRCSSLLEPRQGEKSRYWLKLGKGGMNAGVTREVEQGAGKRTEAVTKIAIRHSTEKMRVGDNDRSVIYWEQDDDKPTETEKAEKPPKSPRTGRPKKERPWSVYKNKLTANACGFEKRVSKNQLFRYAHEADLELGKGAFMELLADWMKDGTVIEATDGQVYVRE